MVCFTNDATLNDVTFGNNSKICIAPGVTVNIQNNVNSSLGNNIIFEIAGTLQFNNTPTFNANLNINIVEGGTLRSGSTGQSNFTFNGSGTNTITNHGTVAVNVLGFQNNNATNLIDNYGTFNIGGNINIKGTTTFINNDVINIGLSYNNNSTSTYINCGTINSNKGFNLGGGKVINTGYFNVGDGQIDMQNSSRIENYGTFTSLGTMNMTSSAIFYNEGLAKLTTVQPNGGTLKGPASSSKKGYIYVRNQMSANGTKVGPNIDLKRYTSYSPDNPSGSQGVANIWNNLPLIYIDYNSTPVTQSQANVTYSCTSCPPIQTDLNTCPDANGNFPPIANDDSYTIDQGSNSTTSVLENDLVAYNGNPATVNNVTISKISTTDPNININTSTGIIEVGSSVSSGIYTLVYQICRRDAPSSCDTATVTITVQSSYCTKPGSTIVGGTPTEVGITNQTKLSTWPQAVPNGYITLESKTNGFVISRVAKSEVITEPKKGMLIYDIAASCVKLYNGTAWKCIERGCNE
ncbi:Ig-like domain-containing protein [Algoriella xinjiangensis]|uniref:Ig-like domain-containing protein n=1 Tax=Algoriella xinjiangensis TaxID=684065 RepID=UPI000F63C6B5|nr:hypothetical protein [Algoriella xinjiangensis]